MYLPITLPSFLSTPQHWMQKSFVLGLIALSTSCLHAGSEPARLFKVAASEPPLNSLNTSLTCNAFTPISSQHFSSLSAQIVDNVPSVLPLCIGGVTGINNLTDADENNFTNINLTGLGCDATLASKSTASSSSFDAGTFAGFRVGSQGLLGAVIASEMIVSTYLNNSLQESRVVVSSTVALDLSLISDDGTIVLGFTTTLPFNEVRIRVKSLVSVLNNVQIYHAVAKQYCEGPPLTCNSETRWIQPLYPVSVEKVEVTGIAVGGIDNVNHLLDANAQNFASFEFPVAALATLSLSVKDQLIDYDASTFAGFKMTSGNLSTLEILNYFSIQTFLNGSYQETALTDDLRVVNADLINGGDVVTGFVSNLPFDEIRLVISQPLSVNLGSIHVYYPIVKTYCQGPVAECNTFTQWQQPIYPIEVNYLDSGINSLACVNCTFSDPTHLIDNDTENFMTIDLLTTAANAAKVSVQNVVDQFEGPAFVGFEIQNSNLINSDVLSAIQICTYLDGQEVDCKSGAESLAVVNSSLLQTTGFKTIGFVADQNFDEVQLLLNNLVNVQLGTVKVKSFVYNKLCDVTLQCDTVYNLNQPDFPVVINGLKTGTSGLACALCDVQNELNVISTSPDDYATLLVPVGVLGGVKLSVQDGIKTYPKGSTAGFVIRDMNALVLADLLESVTICTYKDNTLNECKTGTDLIDLSLILNLFPSESNKTTIGFVTTKDFDEIQITVNALTSVINQLRIFGAFLDTRGADSEDFFCCPRAAKVTLYNQCVGNTFILPAFSNGTWSAAGTANISLNPNGELSFLSSGNATFYFTDSTTSCVSYSTNTIQIFDNPAISSSGVFDICLSNAIQLSSNSQSGQWLSSNADIAWIDANGRAHGIAPGKVSFAFTDNQSQCSSFFDFQAFEVYSCIDPDFNVTFSGVQLEGNAATNDDALGSTIFNPQPVLIKAPIGAQSQITVHPNGSYQFLTNKVGQYIYMLNVCPANQVLCQSSMLNIHVVEAYGYDQSAVSNVDFISVYQGDSLLIPGEGGLLGANDRCVSHSDCLLDYEVLSVVNNTTKTSIALDPSFFFLKPNSGELGLDSFTYLICNEANASLCHESPVFITIKHPSASNSIVAVDDFKALYSNEKISLNVLSNDSDPESDSIFIQVTGSPETPVVIDQGTYFISADGILHFQPAVNYTGPVDIIYTLCDNHVEPACTRATVHLLVMDPGHIEIRCYLEGALMNNNNKISVLGKPLMRDELRKNAFNGQNCLPVSDPYQRPTTYTDVTSFYQPALPGTLSKFVSIPDPQLTFADRGDNSIVDWVFIELRSVFDSTHVFATRSGLLQRDADVVDLDGQSPLSFRGIKLDSFFVAVRHRSHLGVMSLKQYRNQLVDFTDPALPVFDFGVRLNGIYDFAGKAQNTKVKTNYRALWAGDFDGDGKIKFVNPSDDTNQLYFDILNHPENLSGNANYDFAFGYYQGDYDMNGKIKFGNPSDDKNFLQAQILFYGLNAHYLTNFDYFIQQIP